MIVALGMAPPSSHAQSFNRTSDVLFGAVVSAPIAMATRRPWIGLVVGLAAAGIDDGYKMHDSTIRMSPGTAAYHMSLMGAGSLAGYGLGKFQMHLDRKRRHNTCMCKHATG
jgi:hypothetical protein